MNLTQTIVNALCIVVVIVTILILVVSNDDDDDDAVCVSGVMAEALDTDLIGVVVAAVCIGILTIVIIGLLAYCCFRYAYSITPPPPFLSSLISKSSFPPPLSL